MAHFQPYLQDSIIVVAAPDICVSSRGGAIGGLIAGPTAGTEDGPDTADPSADGFYRGDRRALCALHVEVDAATVVPVSGRTDSAGSAIFRGVVRGIGEHGPDPAVLLEQRRRVGDGVLTEQITLTNAGRSEVTARLAVRVGCDLASMEAVKSGLGTPPIAAAAVGSGLDWAAGTDRVELRSTPAPDAVDAAAGTLGYAVALSPDASFMVTLTCRPTYADAAADWAIFASGGPAPWQPVRVQTSDDRLGRLIDTSLADLGALLLRDGDDPFLAAGAPWYLTLFGRDSLWAARMLLPLGTEVAAGTLRILARLQGRVDDSHTDEAPGKIVHEVRKATADHGDMSLPPRYYGTIDATPLWVSLLHDAWRWGLDPDEIAALMPNAEAALSWLMTAGDSDGFLEYVDRSGRGLANQGWKDSSDSIRWRDGELARAPLALCEVQAYAYEAAVDGAALLRAFDLPGADRLDEWAATVRRRFRERFWIDDPAGAYPALALDADSRRVDAVTSSLGQLLGTGLLDADESALVAARVADRPLDAGFGLRTLATGSAGFNPVGYHTGSIWPHDTAIVLRGLARDGHAAAALSLATGLVAAAAAYDFRLPELYGGWGADAEPAPTAYPASCRPQAWSAAGSIFLLQALLGLEADVPAGRITVAPLATSPYLPLTVSGLKVAGRDLTVSVDAAGVATIDCDAGLDVVRR